MDAVAWIADANKRDALHVRTRQVMSKLRQQHVAFVTTEFVLLEVANAFGRLPLRLLAIPYLNTLRGLPDLEIIPANSSLLADGWALYNQRLDKEWSLTDCTSFVVMAREQILEAVTSDHHFQQAGFVRLL